MKLRNDFIMKKNTVITISRQYGSGGRELSQILANKLGIKLYDRQIINLAASHIGIDDMNYEALKRFEEEVPPLPVKFMPFYMFGVSGPQSLNDKIFNAECEVIKKLAKDGSCIILGRCADYVLKNQENVYSFYICANDNFRTNRGKTVYENKSLSDLNEEDLKRGGYYSHYTGHRWGDAANYNLTINTSYISLDQAADLIIEYIEKTQDLEKALDKSCDKNKFPRELICLKEITDSQKLHTYCTKELKITNNGKMNTDRMIFSNILFGIENKTPSIAS